MAARQLPPDFAAALDRVPAARDRFAQLPAERQAEWLRWIDAGRGRRGRLGRIDEAVRRLSGPVASETAVHEVIPPERSWWWVWLLLLALLVIGGLLAWYFLSRGGGDKRTVPDVVGQQEQAAETRVRESDLKALTATGPSNRARGVVFAERPGAGTQVKKGQAITLSISSGPARLTVPDVTGLPVQQATAQLQAKGLSPQQKRVSSTRPKGVVTEQAPQAGVATSKGGTVVLSVSTGVKPVSVPSVVGQQQGAAVTQLTKAGLAPQLQNVSSPQPVGTVVAQKPPAGKQVDKGSTVTINVSKGTGGGGTTTTVRTTTTATTTVARSAAVPSVTGLAQVAALRRVSTAGFRVAMVYVPSSQRAGIVTAQTPSGGSARTGTPVRLSVSEGPNPQSAQSVPSVAGQDQAAATSALQAAGFKVYVLRMKTSNKSQDGVVIYQAPTAGSSIPGGALVAVVVGAFSG